MQTWSVGEVAGLLGVSPSTVRMWGTRYGLNASARSEGGHRRYTADDVARLRATHAQVVDGADPSRAAATVTGLAAPTRARGTRGGPGGSVLAVPGAGRVARGLARAASRLDATAAEETVVAALAQEGTDATWEDVVRPVLVAAGRHWETTGSGIEVEHLLSDALTSAFDRHRASLPQPDGAHAVLLAGGPQEEHVLALHALRCALVERGVPVRLLGPRTPIGVLTVAARRTRAAAVVCWTSTPDPAAVEEIGSVVTAHRGVRVVVAGPGWNGADLDGVTRCVSLPEAAETLSDQWRKVRLGS